MVEAPQKIERYSIAAHGPLNTSETPLTGQLADQVRQLREEIIASRKPTVSSPLPSNLYTSGDWLKL